MSRRVQQPKRQQQQRETDHYQEQGNNELANPLFSFGAEVFWVGHGGGLKS
jgi:hypothetical protein